MNEELGRHRGRESKSECALCGAECESVVHALWECSAYSNIRVIFREKLWELLGNRYANFDKLTSIVLGSKLWDCNFDDLLSLVKEYVVGVWDACKKDLYGWPSQLQSLAEDLQLGGVEGQTDDRLCSSGEVGTGGNLPVCTSMCGSAHDCGCVVNGSNGMVNNNNMRNPSLHFISWGYACCYCCMQLSLVCIHEL